MYYPRLFAFSLNYIDDKQAAEEVVVDTLFKLWQRRSKLDKVKNIKTYLYTMVKNASLDYLKKEKAFLTLDLKQHDTISQPNQYIIEEETYAILFQALEKLPEKCRKVFELSCLEGMAYKDIAEDLQISINTVKSQRSRAIELLRQYLKNHPTLLLILSSF